LKVVRTDIPDVLILEPQVFADARGAVFESYNRRTFRQDTGIEVDFVQDNDSRSVRNVIRGLHYQVQRPQGKLIRALRGEIFDVAVDIRRSSPTFGKWVGFNLSGTNGRMAWIPPGFAHGLLALSEEAHVLYKMTELWAPELDRTILWNDPQIGVRWPVAGAPILSAKDQAGKPLADAEVFADVFR
jgi:dTDP-4-dehydrorhamnose 3,5-epimerase